jgi:hypothetical protein
MTATGPGQNGPKSDARFIGDVPGCFVFLDRSGHQWDAQSFPFNARSVATSRAVVTAEIAVERGERVALRFDTIGIRRGVIERALKDGFIVNFVDATSAEVSVDARIDWLNRKTRGRAEDRRAHKRVIPRNGNAVLILGTDNHMDCRIKDMSCSGAAIVAPVMPPIGNLVAVGAVPARVVRHFEGGFGVRFLEFQVLAELEGLLTLHTRRERKMAARKLGFAA